MAFVWNFPSGTCPSAMKDQVPRKGWISQQIRRNAEDVSMIIGKRNNNHYKLKTMITILMMIITNHYDDNNI